MEIFLVILCVIMSIFLIGAVLIQPGKADMVSGMGGLGGQMNNLFGVRQGRNVLQNVTIGLAVAIMLLSIVINKVFLPTGAAERAPVTQGAEMPVAVPSSAPAPGQQPQQQQPQQQQPAQQGN